MNRSLFYLIVCLLLGVSVSAQADHRRAVILSTDCGADMDDQWALSHLALSPEIDLRGVITTHAFFLPKPEAEYTARVANEVLDHLPLTHRPPVVAGSSIALEDRTKPLPNAAVDLLLSESRKFTSKHRLTVLVIGAATDVASALIIDPTLADRIEIVAMAFYNWPDGGDEWNVKNDPKAWQVLLDSPCPITVGDQAVCKQFLAMTVARADTLFGQRGAAGRYLVGLLRDWMQKHPQPNGTWPIWDEVTVSFLLGMAHTETHPRPSMNDAMHFEFIPNSRRTIQWITYLYTPRFWDDFTRKLDAANRRKPR